MDTGSQQPAAGGVGHTHGEVSRELGTTMKDHHQPHHHVSVMTTIAVVLFTIAGMFVADGFTDRITPDDFVQAGLYLVVVAGTLAIREFIAEHERSMKTMELNAFELGRDSSELGILRRHRE